MALEGTVKTPFGQVSKKTAVGVGAGLAVLGVIVWYRQKQTADQPDANVADAEINPATGYPYGSPEDAAALAQQAAYVSASPTGASGGGNVGGSGSSNTDTVISNNSEWTQAVLAYFQDNGIIENVSGLAGALGKYISGSYVSDNDVALIQQAIAVKGQPPVSGSTGYPPNLNRTPPGSGTPNKPPTTTTPPKATPKNVGQIKGRTTTSTKTSITTNFSATNAQKYFILVNGALRTTVTKGPVTIPGLKPNTRYTVGVQAVAANGTRSSISNTTLWTKK